MESKGVALVTGASKGIGRAIALRLADDGFDVALNSRSSSKEELDTLSQEITQKGRRTSIVLGDVSQEADVRRMVDSTVRELGGLDVVSGSVYVTYLKNMAHSDPRWLLTLGLLVVLPPSKTVCSL